MDVIVKVWKRHPRSPGRELASITEVLTEERKETAAGMPYSSEKLDLGSDKMKNTDHSIRVRKDFVVIFFHRDNN